MTSQELNEKYPIPSKDSKGVNGGIWSSQIRDVPVVVWGDGFYLTFMEHGKLVTEWVPTCERTAAEVPVYIVQAVIRQWEDSNVNPSKTR